MILNCLPKLPRSMIESRFNDHQESLVHTQSHLRIIHKKLLYLVSFKRVNFGWLNADGIDGIKSVLDHCRPAERKPGFYGSNAGCDLA